MSLLRVGDKAPAWSDLPGVDGKTHSLKDFGDARAVVVVFTCGAADTTCTCSETAPSARVKSKRGRVPEFSVNSALRPV